MALHDALLVEARALKVPVYIARKDVVSETLLPRPTEQKLEAAMWLSLPIELVTMAVEAPC